MDHGLIGYPLAGMGENAVCLFINVRLTLHNSCSLFPWRPRLVGAAIYHATPTVVMPFAADQDSNAMAAQAKGFGRHVHKTGPAAHVAGTGCLPWQRGVVAVT